MTSGPLQWLAGAVAPSARESLLQAGPALERLLGERWNAATAAWPGVVLAPAVFWTWVGTRLPVEGAPLDELTLLHTDELYLTCACSHGDRVAHALLERRYFRAVIGSVMRLKLPSVRGDDLEQLLRERLLVGAGVRQPRISAYGGRGDLGSWLRVTAVRCALRLARTHRREARAQAMRMAEMSALVGDAELAHLRRDLKPLVRGALAQSLSALGAREKNLLCQHYLDGLGIGELSALYGTHRVTVTRWLDAIRQRLLDQTRQVIVERARVSRPECDSIIRMVHSQLELTLNGLLE
jgi:RNA polymerase sigma-70 factor, ECF subfamily